MQNKKRLVTYTVLILIISLQQGCSGHLLQDLIDGDSSKESSSKQTDIKDENSKSVAPSQNKALNSISPSSTAGDDNEEHRQIQKSTNRWIEDEWEPLTKGNTLDSTDVESNASVIKNDANTTQSQEDNSSSGLQYYVDKAELYFENKKKRDANKTDVPSHTEKIDAMPGIGKSKGR